ncbi:hypothetical protein [Bradyrhizobium brasilense]|uniref:hypothetical protein n=1 Tax=Bradyrhizobium brasilense TaxID=1419277 RepID=UPI001E2ABA75|nr:hypothetical protein [Bradyrhizobium brasilense]
MPMIDVTIPEGALKPEAEARLIKELGDILIGHEGFDPANKVAQGVTVVFLHRPAPFMWRASHRHRHDSASSRRSPRGSTPKPRARPW